MQQESSDKQLDCPDQTEKLNTSNLEVQNTALQSQPNGMVYNLINIKPL